MVDRSEASITAEAPRACWWRSSWQRPKRPPQLRSLIAASGRRQDCARKCRPLNSPGPAVTVVIPVWGARYVASLERAIASVRAQDADVPIIVADNASDVEVPEISGTTLVRSPRRLSVGEARNLGLERVETEYVVIVLDADDELTDGRARLAAGGDRRRPRHRRLRDVAAGCGYRRSSSDAASLRAGAGARSRGCSRWRRRPGRSIRSRAARSCGRRWVRDAGGVPRLRLVRTGFSAVSQAFRGRIVVDPRPAAIYHAHPESLLRRVAAERPTSSRRRSAFARGWPATRPCRAGRAPCSH